MATTTSFAGWCQKSHRGKPFSQRKERRYFSVKGYNVGYFKDAAMGSRTGKFDLRKVTKISVPTETAELGAEIVIDVLGKKIVLQFESDSDKWKTLFCSAVSKDLVVAALQQYHDEAVYEAFKSEYGSVRSPPVAARARRPSRSGRAPWALVTPRRGSCSRVPVCDPRAGRQEELLALLLAAAGGCPRRQAAGPGAGPRAGSGPGPRAGASPRFGPGPGRRGPGRRDPGPSRYAAAAGRERDHRPGAGRTPAGQGQGPDALARHLEQGQPARQGPRCGPGRPGQPPRRQGPRFGPGPGPRPGPRPSARLPTPRHPSPRRPGSCRAVPRGAVPHPGCEVGCSRGGV